MNVRRSTPAVSRFKASAVSDTRSPAVWYRSAGSFAIARAITTSIAPGSSARSSVTEGGGSLRWACINDASLSRRNGGCPVRHSNSTAPSE